MRRSLMNFARWIPTILLLAGCTAGSAIESSDYPIVPITPELVAAQVREMPVPTVAPALQAASSYQYRIGRGDVLSFRLIEGFETPAMMAYTPPEPPQPIKVEDDGTANFPYAGRLHAENLTAAEMRSALGRTLAKYFKSPRFDLQVQEFRSRSIIVSGAVNKPGLQYFDYTPLTVSKAIEGAGGSLPNADLAHATLKHASGQEETLDAEALFTRADRSQERVLKPGDTLLVGENHRNRVFLMGEVLKPGALYIKGGKLSLTEALNESQTANNDPQAPNIYTASFNKIYVLRGAVNDADKAADTPAITIYSLDTSSPTAYVTADGFQLKPRDVIYLAAAPVTEWHRFITQLLPGNLTLSTSKTVN